MLTRRLGKSGIEVSALGMGSWAIGGPWTWVTAWGRSVPSRMGKDRRHCRE